MSDTKMIVLSEPPEGVSAEDFNAWYEVHTGEVLRLPGFRSVQRFAMSFLRSSSGEPVGYGYLTMYDIDGEFDAAFQSLREAVDSGRMYFPDWYDGVRSAGLRGLKVAESSAVPS